MHRITAGHNPSANASGQYDLTTACVCPAAILRHLGGKGIPGCSARPAWRWHAATWPGAPAADHLPAFTSMVVKMTVTIRQTTILALEAFCRYSIKSAGSLPIKRPDMGIGPHRFIRQPYAFEDQGSHWCQTRRNWTGHTRTGLPWPSMGHQIPDLPLIRVVQVDGGATIWSRRESTVMIASMAPAAPSRWPVMDLRELTISRDLVFAKHLLHAAQLGHIAEGWRGAVGIDVTTCSGAMPASFDGFSWRAPPFTVRVAAPSCDRRRCSKIAKTDQLRHRSWRHGPGVRTLPAPVRRHRHPARNRRDPCPRDGSPWSARRCGWRAPLAAAKPPMPMGVDAFSAPPATITSASP